MIFPTLHLNGSSADSLIKDYQEAADAAYEAVKALGNVDFHGRDYYTQDTDGKAFQQARDEHLARLAKLESVRVELGQILLNVVDQRLERERAKVRS